MKRIVGPEDVVFNHVMAAQLSLAKAHMELLDRKPDLENAKKHVQDAVDETGNALKALQAG